MLVRRIGHRGGGASDAPFNRERDGKTNTARFPENTITSHVMALARGADGVETDLIEPKDPRELVLVHSNDYGQHIFKPTAAQSFALAGKGFIDQLTVTEIQRHLLIGVNGTEQIPTLGELLVAVRGVKPEAFLQLELKGRQDTRPSHQRPGGPGLSLAEKTIQTLERHDWALDQTRFSSFALSYLAEMAGVHNKAELALLCDLPPSQDGDVGSRMFCDRDDVYLPFTKETIDLGLQRVPTLRALHPEVQSVDEETVRYAVARGITRIGVWGWREFSPEHPGADGQRFADAYKRAVDICDRAGVEELDLITDHVEAVGRLLGLAPARAPRPEPAEPGRALV